MALKVDFRVLALKVAFRKGVGLHAASSYVDCRVERIYPAKA